MPSIEEYVKHADDLAQDVINAWALTAGAGKMSSDFEPVFNKACQYRNAKRLADNYRQFGEVLSRPADAIETIARQDFAQVYKLFWEKHHRAA